MKSPSRCAVARRDLKDLVESVMCSVRFRLLQRKQMLLEHRVIGIGTDGPAAGNDLADARGRHANRLGQAVLAETERLQKLLIKQFARGDGGEAVHRVHQWSSTISTA